MNVKLEGKMEQIVRAAIDQGLVKNQIEAIRVGLLELNTKYQLIGMNSSIPTERISKKELAEHKRILKEMESGKEYSLNDIKVGKKK